MFIVHAWKKERKKEWRLGRRRVSILLLLAARNLQTIQPFQESVALQRAQVGVSSAINTEYVNTFNKSNVKW